MRNEADSEKLFQLLRFHLENHENIGVQDIYKCIYQGVCGAEHLLTNTAAARGFLEKEWQEFVTLCQLEKFSFPLEEVAQFTQYLIRNNYPVHHHSLLYKKKNKPAYRVIKLTELFSFE